MYSDEKRPQDAAIAPIGLSALRDNEGFVRAVFQTEYYDHLLYPFIVTSIF